MHTHENVAGTCVRDMLQRHVPSCEPIHLKFEQHQFGGDFVPATCPNFMGQIAATYRCNILLNHVQATFSCVCKWKDFKIYVGDVDKNKHMNEGVVSKETVVLRRWGSSIQKFGFINGVDNVNWPPYRDSKS